MNINTAFAEIIVQIIPTKFVPKGHKNVNGTIVALNENERRVHLERYITHQITWFLDKYSPIRKTIKFTKKRRLIKTQTQFFSLIGQITLTHAGIEQGLKNALICDWGVEEKFKEAIPDAKPGDKQSNRVDINKLFSRKLEKRFLVEIKKRNIPNDKYMKYEQLYEDYWQLSSTRNEMVKAVYSFNFDTAEISKVNEQNHSNFGKRYSSGEHFDYEKMLSMWIPAVELVDLQELRDNIVDLAGKFQNLRYEILREKITLRTELFSEKV